MSNVYKIIALSVVFFVCVNGVCACGWSWFDWCTWCTSDTGVDDHDIDIDKALDHSLGESSFNDYVQADPTYWFGVG